MKTLPPNKYLLGLLSSFENRFQAMSDKIMEEISWKQFFLIICMEQCVEDPTLNELAEMVGSSHQNVKQLLMKLERKGFVTIYSDVADKRKQRIRLTDQCKAFCWRNNEKNSVLLQRLFNGISEEQLMTTIQTITALDRNLSRENMDK